MKGIGVVDLLRNVLTLIKLSLEVVTSVQHDSMLVKRTWHCRTPNRVVKVVIAVLHVTFPTYL